MFRPACWERWWEVGHSWWTGVVSGHTHLWSATRQLRWLLDVVRNRSAYPGGGPGGRIPFAGLPGGGPGGPDIIIGRYRSAVVVTECG
jgi:hypothetical protein